MTLNELTNLLKRWQELEPERCKFGDGSPVWKVKLQKQWWALRLPPVYMSNMALELAVREALDARLDAAWQVGRGPEGKVFCEVRIGTASASCAAHEPAQAMLSAYIAVLGTRGYALTLKPCVA